MQCPAVLKYCVKNAAFWSGPRTSKIQLKMYDSHIFCIKEMNRQDNGRKCLQNIYLIEDFNPEYKKSSHNLLAGRQIAQ